jgi:hypothetical protein
MGCPFPLECFRATWANAAKCTADSYTARKVPVPGFKAGSRQVHVDTDLPDTSGYDNTNTAVMPRVGAYTPQHAETQPREPKRRSWFRAVDRAVLGVITSLVVTGVLLLALAVIH